MLTGLGIIKKGAKIMLNLTDVKSKPQDQKYINLETDEIATNRIFINEYTKERYIFIKNEFRNDPDALALVSVSSGTVVTTLDSFDIMKSKLRKDKKTIILYLEPTTELILKEFLDTDVDKLYYDPDYPKEINIRIEPYTTSF